MRKARYSRQLTATHEAMMRPLPIALLAATVLLAFSAAGPANAASTAQEFSAQKRQAVKQQRPKTRVVVRGRSYLDAGTEVMPGERKFTDYVYGPNYSPTSVIDNTPAGGIRSPLPDNFTLPGWSRF
jgi:hypothetical protein